MEKSSFSPKEVKSLPNKPGIYRFLSKTNQILYVGKAKDLKKRASSYFHQKHLKGKKTQRLVSETYSIEITIVNSEFDAFLLENTLIKEYQPKYNILLKDDKTFPFICVTNERFPRVLSTRRILPEFGTYYGPYASVRAMNNILELIRNVYHIRTCKYNLSESNIANKKFKPCLEYHIGKCKAPCIDHQSESDYMIEIKQVHHILKGNIKPVRDYFSSMMLQYSSDLEFEKAEEVKQRYLLMDKFQSNSIIVNTKLTHLDIFTIVSDETSSYINYLKIHNGSINQTLNIEVKKQLDEDDSEILSLYIIELRNKFKSNATLILSNIKVPGEFGGEVIVPQRGDKRKLIEMSLKNALYFKRDKSFRSEYPSRDQKVLLQLQEDLQLKTLPSHIECFDNSNIQGHNPVASMVYFKNGKPLKKAYRKYNIKTVSGPDDFASMYEIILRRYSRVKNEGSSLPDLIVVDGGKGQLNAAISALTDLELYGSIPIIGIAKRLEEIYFPFDEVPLHIDKKSPSLKLLQHIRNEAHRFAISFHRDKRSKTTLKSKLDGIKGIGPASKQTLLSHFRSFQNIVNADRKEIEAQIGIAKTDILFEELKKRD